LGHHQIVEILGIPVSSALLRFEFLYVFITFLNEVKVVLPSMRHVLFVCFFPPLMLVVYVACSLDANKSKILFRNTGCFKKELYKDIPNVTM
jgi:hypothetical protein